MCVAAASHTTHTTHPSDTSARCHHAIDTGQGPQLQPGTPHSAAPPYIAAAAIQGGCAHGAGVNQIWL